MRPKTPTSKKAAAAKSRAGAEWMGGTVTLPAKVTGEGEPYNPEVLFWLSGEGRLLGFELGRPGDMVKQVCESLRSTLEKHKSRLPGGPARLRVVSPELAQALRMGMPHLEVVCAPTPEIEAIAGMLTESLGGEAEFEESYLWPDVDLAAIELFFRASAALFRAKPWNTVPSDDCLFSVSIEALGVRDVALSVIGQEGQSLGFLLFASLEHFDDFLEVAEAMERGDLTDLPPHISLNFEASKALSAAVRKEVDTHRWELADANAYPMSFVWEEDNVSRPPTTNEVTIITAISLALTKVLRETGALLSAWNGGEPVSRKVSVETYVGDIEVSLRAPYPRKPKDSRTARELIAKLFDLGVSDAEMDPEHRRRLGHALLDLAVASPQGRRMVDGQGCLLVMEVAASCFNATIATLTADGLRELLFEVIPRNVGVLPSWARPIIEENRAFYAFLQREGVLAQAEDCLRVLSGQALKRLEKGLCDTSKFNREKLVFISHQFATSKLDAAVIAEAKRAASGKSSKKND